MVTRVVTSQVKAVRRLRIGQLGFPAKRYNFEIIHFAGVQGIQKHGIRSEIDLSENIVRKRLAIACDPRLVTDFIPVVSGRDRRLVAMKKSSIAADAKGISRAMPAGVLLVGKWHAGNRSSR
jgi:hypothetical protein